jgi:hypothetical protein
LLETFLSRFFAFELNITISFGSFRLIENVQLGGEDLTKLGEEVFELNRGDRVGDTFNKDVGFI